MSKYYYKDGTITKQYIEGGTNHRVDGPAIEVDSGARFWYIDGNIHRVDGPAIENTNGDKWWYLDGKLHRVDGPAVEYADGTQKWYGQNSSLHRIDGPAIERGDGSNRWYIDGENYSEEQFNKLIKEAKDLPLALRLIDPREWVREI